MGLNFGTYTGVPPAAIAAAAWSWVEKMLQLVQVTSAPKDVKVSMRTAVWMAGTELVDASPSVKAAPTHVQAASNTGTCQWLVCGVLLAGCHETWHLIFSELDLSATEGSQAEVSDLEFSSWSTHRDSCMGMVGCGRERCCL